MPTLHTGPSPSGCGTAMCTVQLGAHLHFPNLYLALGSMNSFPCETPAGTASQVTSQCPNCSWLLVLVGLGWGTAEPMTPNTWSLCHPPSSTPRTAVWQIHLSCLKHRAQGCPWLPCSRKGLCLRDPVLEGQDSSPGFCCSPFTEQLFPWILLLSIHRAALLLARDYSC